MAETSAYRPSRSVYPCLRAMLLLMTCSVVSMGGPLSGGGGRAVAAAARVEARAMDRGVVLDDPGAGPADRERLVGHLVDVGAEVLGVEPGHRIVGGPHLGDVELLRGHAEVAADVPALGHGAHPARRSRRLTTTRCSTRRGEAHRFLAWCCRWPAFGWTRTRAFSSANQSAITRSVFWFFGVLGCQVISCSVRSWMW